MAWKDLGDDRKVEIIVDPDYRGDLIAVASRHPVWIVASPENQPRILAAWETEDHGHLHEINQYETPDPNDRLQSLVGTLDEIDNEHGYTALGSYDGLVVNGLEATNVLKEKLARLGFNITRATPGGFLAEGRLTGFVGTKAFSEL
jgi:hypothetical protein